MGTSHAHTSYTLDNAEVISVVRIRDITEILEGNDNKYINSKNVREWMYLSYVRSGAF